MPDFPANPKNEVPKPSPRGKAGRAALNAAGSIPFVGGIFSAAAGAWGEKEQETVNNVLQQWLQQLEEELGEKAAAILDIMARIDVQDQEIKARVESDEFQGLVKKTFRNWSNIDTEQKRRRVRNLLSNAAATRLVSDDVVRLFIDWTNKYSDFHFQVVGIIWQQGPISRYDIWQEIGRNPAREDSADADLFRLLIDELSQGRVIRQQRATDRDGNFLRKQTVPTRKGEASRVLTSSFDREKLYVLTELGSQFVSYAMNELVARVEFADID